MHNNFELDAYTTDDIEYVWDPLTPVVVGRRAGGDLPNFVIEQCTPTNCTSKTATGNK
jgi:hypothetical protein